MSATARPTVAITALASETGLRDAMSRASMAMTDGTPRGIA